MIAYIKNNIFTGQKLMMTKSEYEKMNLIKYEKTHRRFINRIVLLNRIGRI